MSDLPIVAWAEYARESLIGVSMQHDEESPFLQRALTDHAAATASLASAQQRITELERERDHWRANHDNQLDLKQRLSRSYGELCRQNRDLLQVALRYGPQGEITDQDVAWARSVIEAGAAPARGIVREGQ